jgi:hypothetical protein
MKILFKFCVLILLIAQSGSPATASGEIHYIGFNRFVAAQAMESGTIFDDYIRQLRPIMSRYGMTVDSYDVQHGGSDELTADVITFGTATDNESFQAFFEDPEFQQIFPMLLAALSDHQVIFTSDPFAVRSQKGAHTLLTLDWVNGDSDAGLARLEALNDKLRPVFGTYGVELAAQTSGVMSNRGLAAEVTPTAPPQLLELWSIRDAHGFFDDPVVRSSTEAKDQVLSRSEAFWLSPREIR